VAGLDEVRAAPSDVGLLELIVARPDVGARRVLDVAELSCTDGLVGDSWLARGSRSPDRSAESDRQLTLMNARAAALFAGDRSVWGLAGDQLYVDLDLSDDNLRAGSQLAVGDAIVEVTPAPHTGCAKFRARFGMDAWRLLSTPEGKRLHLRGINARVVRAGTIHAGDPITKVG
jgi:hypothetical protein